MLNLSEITEQFNALIYNSKQHVSLVIKIIAGIWIFNFINWLTGSTLNILGTIPRNKKGILGITSSWILHANFNHLFFNSIPLFILGLLIISYNKQMFFNISIIIIILDGVAVWLFARKGNHMGASGLVAGYFGFMLIFAYKTASIVSIILAIVILYYFGGIILSFFPTDAKTSWEAHLFGFLSGIAAFFIFNSELFDNIYKTIQL